ncbi:DNA topoisomerase [Clostridium sp. Marseille-P299]|uniref:DNA topoisomerase n=1 Tax=Clostridium sp. Marseille-P299 TaxID=1805477 RepID=UPI00082AA5B3|nr:DNA topoisomerase [Clostridium sp. Marseille-P299]
MSKSLYISEKPSVAQEFAKALKVNFKKHDGYMEAEDSIVTWCVGHLVTMAYPESYDPALKRWSLETIPFLPKDYLYEVIPNVSKQFKTVSALLNRKDVDKIYVCTDSGREGEYIYRLVDQMAKVPNTKEKRRVWIDSQTEEEILRGIKEAKPLSAYDNLSDAAYLRAQEDYLMGINFSRVLTLKYGNAVNNFLKSEKRQAISVGRVMTCVLGMVVRREREIRAFVKTPFYRVTISLDTSMKPFDGEFKAVEGSKFYLSPKLYKENGFREKIDAEKLIEMLTGYEPEYEAKQENNKNSYLALLKKDTEEALQAEIIQIEKKKENKNPPLLFNLAELQNECSKLYKISPDETLKFTQELYEKKLVTYPRTDARVLSTAVAKEIHKNIGGLKNLGQFRPFAEEILEVGSYKNIAKTRYVNDKQITDHYAIIPTGQGFSALGSLSLTAKKIYVTIVKRFLSIFYPPAVYQKISLTTKIDTECFFSNFKVMVDEGYLKVAGYQGNATDKNKEKDGNAQSEENSTDEDAENDSFGLDFFEVIKGLKKGMKLNVNSFCIKEGETAPPKRYNSGSLILAMENAGQLIEDEELRAQIKGSGIGTSATRAEILNKLVKINYLSLNKKTQIMTPSLLGEMIYDVVNASIKSLLNAELTASWEKGLTYVSEGSITKDEYTQKLNGFVQRMTEGVKSLNNENQLFYFFNEAASNYKR